MKSILRPALKFFLTFLLLYAVVIGISLVPQVSAFFNKIYRQPTQPILQTTLPKAHLQLRTDEADPGIFWVDYASKQQVEEQMKQASASGQKVMDVQGNNAKIEFYYLFLSFYLFFLVLMVLSPIDIKSKLIRILIGTFVFYFYTVFKTWLALLDTFNQPEIGIYHLGDFTAKIVHASIAGMTLGVNLLVVLLLWVVLVFNKNNWQVFMKK
jgi:hypothetical protein